MENTSLFVYKRIYSYFVWGISILLLFSLFICFCLLVVAVVVFCFFFFFYILVAVTVLFPCAKWFLFQYIYVSYIFAFCLHHLFSYIGYYSVSMYENTERKRKKLFDFFFSFKCLDKFSALISVHSAVLQLHFIFCMFVLCLNGFVINT